MGINKLDEVFKQSGGLNETVKKAISFASQGRFFMIVSPKQQYLVNIIKNEAEADFFEKEIDK